MEGPVSAFARRKAAQSALSKATAPIVTQTSPTQDHQQEVEASTPSKKKRKREEHRKPRLPIPALPKESVNIQDNSDKEHSRGSEVSDSSDVEREFERDNSDLEILSQSAVAVRKLSTFSPTRSTVLSDTESTWTLRLHPNDNLVILGQYDLWVRSGAVSILGAVVHASSKLYRVYAPSTHSIPSIRVITNPFGPGNPPCEISIISCGNRIRLLKQVAPKFGRIWNGTQNPTDIARSFVNIRSSTDDPYKRPLRLLEPPSDWQTMISKLVSGDYVASMVCGPKGSGKSTLCRMLVNALLPKVPTKQQDSRLTPNSDFVTFLDLDPGQSEYSPPGELSLHKIRCCNFGPPFTHPTSNGGNQVVRAHHFGHLSLKEDPQHYYRCALDLFSHYKSMSANNRLLPLVVNCSGWIQGSGLELLVNLIEDLDLKDVIYMSLSGPEEVVERLSKAANREDIRLHQLSSHVSDIATRTAADLRMMQTLSYFHLDEAEGDNLRWTPSPLASIPPMVVHYAGPQQGFCAFLVLGDEQNPEFLHTILEGCIVGITVIEDLNAFLAARSQDSYNTNGRVSNIKVDSTDTECESAPQSTTDHNNVATEPPNHSPTPILRSPTGLPYLPPHHHTTPPPNPTLSRSLGQALIRSIDPRTQTLHLQTPIPTSTLRTIALSQQQQIVLVRGNLDTPTWAYAEGFEYEKARRRRREGVAGADDREEFGAEGVREWAGRQPWANVVEGGGGRRMGSARVRRVRRGIRYRGQAQAQVQVLGEGGGGRK